MNADVVESVECVYQTLSLHYYLTRTYSYDPQ